MINKWEQYVSLLLQELRKNDRVHLKMIISEELLIKNEHEQNMQSALQITQFSPTFRGGKHHPSIHLSVYGYTYGS